MTEPRRPLPGSLLLLAAAAAAPLSFRAAAALARPAGLHATALRGVAADLALSGLVAAALAAAAGRRLGWRVAAVVGLGLWTLLHYGNLEHVLANGSHLTTTFAGYATDTTFAAGSLFAVTRPGLLLTCLAASSAAAVLGLARWEASHALALVPAGVSVATAAVLLAWALDPAVESWRQSDFFLLALGGSPGVRAPATVSAGDLPRTLCAPDLDGEPRTALGRRRSVILLMIESASGGYDPSVAARQGRVAAPSMPGLSARPALRYSSFVSLQRQTNRGEYAILCGDFPYLAPRPSKMTEQAADTGAPCLPAVLAREGYHTAYLQAADLGFMLKDRFMRAAGFEEVVGAEAFPGHAGPWGPDDRQFLMHALAQVERLRARDEPYFLALLTVGTHHPYGLPADFAEDPDADPYHRAVSFADRAAVAFLEGLAARGVLDDTLVLVTSDESAGYDAEDDLLRQLSHQHGLLHIEGAGIAPGEVPEIFAQSDLALSVLDYLGLADRPQAFTGRSFFRRYERPRYLPFGNVYAQRVFLIDPERRLHRCDATLEACSTFALDPAGIFLPGARPLPAAPEAQGWLAALLAEAPEASDEGRPNVLFPPGEHALPGAQRRTLAWVPDVQLRPDQSLIVTLALTAHLSPGQRIQIMHALGGGDGLRRFQIPPLADGEALRLSYRYATDEAQSDLGLVLEATPSEAGSRLTVTEASWTLGPRQVGEESGPHALRMERNDTMRERLRRAPTFPDRPLVVAHAGGRVRGLDYTNSREALDAAVERGFSHIEVDILEASDGVPVLLHDLDESRGRLFDPPLPEGATSAQLLSAPMREGLTPLTLEGALAWLATREGVALVTDVKGDDNVRLLADVARRHPGLRARIVPQIYAPEELAPVRTLGYPRVILTLYRTAATDDEVVALARTGELYAVTMVAARASRAGFADRLREAGVPVYVHTVNDPGDAMKLRQLGVHGIYTDILTAHP